MEAQKSKSSGRLVTSRLPRISPRYTSRQNRGHASVDRRNHERHHAFPIDAQSAAKLFGLDQHAAFLDFEPADASFAQPRLHALHVEGHHVDHFERRHDDLVMQLVASEIRDAAREWMQLEMLRKAHPVSRAAMTAASGS